MCIIGIIAVVFVVLLPTMMRPRQRHKASCVNQLKQTSLCFKQWALDNNDKFPMQVSVTNGGTMELVRQGNVFANFLVMSNELNTPKVLICLAETEKRRLTATTFGNRPIPGQIPFTNNNNTSYFVGVDAEDAKPQMLLVGDSHFALGGRRVPPGLMRLGTNSPVSWPRPIRDRHERGGNIGLSDGSVMNCSNDDLRRLLRNSGDATNRLAIP